LRSTANQRRIVEDEAQKVLEARLTSKLGWVQVKPFD
jgi:hypothetical protein